MSKRRLYVDKDNKKLLGVCAGLANYMEVSALIVRIVFVVTVLFGAVFLVPAYFIFYFCLAPDTGNFKRGVTDNPVFCHLKNVDYKKKLYRNVDKGKCLGVCAGIADYLEVGATLVRIGVVVVFLVAGPIPWLAYFAAYFLLDKKAPLTMKSRFESMFSRSGSKQHSPNHGSSFNNSTNNSTSHQESSHQERSHQSSRDTSDLNGDGQSDYSSRRRDIRRCTRKFKNIHARLVKMEAYITSSRFKLHQEFKNIPK